MFLKGCCFVRAITGSEYYRLEERFRPPELGNLSHAELPQAVEGHTMVFFCNAIDLKHQEDFL
jgi:hypothetical protein